jgi:hypothetical protein
MTGANGDADPGARRDAMTASCTFPRSYPGRYRWSGSGVARTRVACQGGAGMDPVVAAFGTALVGAIATDAWQQVREAVTGL